MGKRKKRWTSEEESALMAGVNKYGTGKWKDILTDEQFAPSLINRSNVDLKDKWRNLLCNASSSVVAPQRSRHKQTRSWSIQLRRVVTATGLKMLWVIIMNISMGTMLGIGVQTQWQLLLMLTNAEFLGLRIYDLSSIRLVKRWKDWHKFLKIVWRLYKWLETFSLHVKVHLMV